MKTPFFTAIKGLAALALTVPAIAYAQPRTFVEMNCTNDNDTVGARTCTALRDVLARSPRYGLVVTGTWVINIVSVDALADIPGEPSQTLSAISMSVSHNGYFVSSVAEACGAKQTADCAQILYASFDKYVSEAR